MKEYADLDIDVIGVKLDCVPDPVSSIVYLFQREKFISIYVGESIRKKGSWTLRATRYNSLASRQDLLIKIADKFSFTLKEIYCFVSDNILVGFWCECQANKRDKYENSLIRQLKPLVNTKVQFNQSNKNKDDEKSLAMIYSYVIIKRKYQKKLKQNGQLINL